MLDTNWCLFTSFAGLAAADWHINDETRRLFSLKKEMTIFSYASVKMMIYDSRPTISQDSTPSLGNFEDPRGSPKEINSYLLDSCQSTDNQPASQPAKHRAMERLTDYIQVCLSNYLPVFSIHFSNTSPHFIPSLILCVAVTMTSWRKRGRQLPKTTNPLLN